MNTLVVVAQKALARFFVQLAPGGSLRELEALEHPESALANAELVTDGPGAVRERMGPQVRAAQPQNSPKEHEAEVFAREVAARLVDYRLGGAYGRAVLIAAPTFLGLLRASLSDADRRFVTAELAKNVATHDVDAITAQLEDVLVDEVITPPISAEALRLLRT